MLPPLYGTRTLGQPFPPPHYAPQPPTKLTHEGGEQVEEIRIVVHRNRVQLNEIQVPWGVRWRGVPPAGGWR